MCSTTKKNDTSRAEASSATEGSVHVLGDRDADAATTTVAPSPPSSPVSLSRKELWDITFLVLAFSCVVASLTLVVGTGAQVILTVGGSLSLAPFALAAVFMGMSFVSLTATHWIFTKWGRKIGFGVGSAIGIVGVLLGCWGLVQSSPVIVLVAQGVMGSGLGMGMYLRYSAVEVVAPEFSSRAVSWVLAGGCLAAFVGPEMSQVTKGIFGDDDNLTYVGSFMMAGCFFILEAICVSLVGFPSSSTKSDDTQQEVTKYPSSSSSSSGENIHDVVRDVENEEDLDDEEAVKKDTNIKSRTTESDANANASDGVLLGDILRQSNFVFPLGVAILSWTIMALPMSIFRVTMSELGFTDRQSLTVIEFHFLAMYAPGFWSGSFIKQYGILRACHVTIVCFVVTLGIFLSIQDNSNSTAAWFLGFIFLGIGWNFGFSTATIWSTQSYQQAMHLKAKVQAANECFMFLLSGAAIFSAGYLYEDAGGGGIGGWRLLNAALFAFVALLLALVVAASRRGLGRTC